MGSRSACVVLIALLSAPFVLAQDDAATERRRAAAERHDPARIVSMFLASGTPALTSYRARRTLEASTRGGRMTASLEAMTWLNADGTFHYQVTSEKGSALIRKRVLLAALEEECRARNERDTSGDLTPANYDFRVDEAGADNLLQMHVTPRRKSVRLLEGTVFATSDAADMVRVEGRLSQRPSFWTRRVDVARHYARVGGVRVPSEMRSRADVLIVGESTFSMTYDYLEINGHAVQTSAMALAAP